MSQDAIKTALQTGLRHYGLSFALEPLMHYLSLLDKWNQAYNLTAVRDMESMLTKHIFDSLAVGQWLQGERIIDVGSGAGLPGIPLSIIFPDRQFTLLDSNGKKTRFLQEIRRQLGLKQVEVVQSRLESYRPAQGFDTVISRAFSSLAQMLDWSRHLCREEGIWLAMKGQLPTEELKAIDYPYTLQTYQVPELTGERCCVIINNKKG